MEGVQSFMNNRDFVFVKNQGQWPEEVKFRASSNDAALFFYHDAIDFSLRKTLNDPQFGIQTDWKKEESLPHEKVEMEYLQWTWNFEGSNPQTHIVQSQIVESKYVAFRNGSTQPQRDEMSSMIHYRSLYPNIDLDFYTREDRLFKYDFRVYPGGNPAEIRIRPEGIESMLIAENGDLVMKTAWGDFAEQAPYTYQIIGGQKAIVKSAWKIWDDGSFGFELGDYDPSFELIIDPIQVDWSTYFYGEGRSASTQINFAYTWVYDVDIDDDDHVYITGVTSDRFISRFNQYDTTFNGGAYDAFVCKMSPNGDSILNFSYIGGSGWEYAFNITVNSRQEPVISGFTYNSNYPVTPGAFDTVPNGVWYKGFITKFSKDFDSLIFSTYFGGSSYNIIYELQLDAAGDLYIVGGTTSSDFPVTSDAWQRTFGGGGTNWWMGGDGFFSKLSADGKRLLYGTYIGGEDADRIFGMHFNDSGEVYLCGYTRSKDFVTTAGSQFMFRSAARIQGDDGLMMKFKKDLKTLVFSNIMGGSGDERFESIFVNEVGEVYLGGFSNSTNFPTTFKAFQKTNQGGYDLVIVKVRREGTNALYSTYLGGSGNEYYNSGWWFNSNIKLAANTKDEAIICGYTQSTDFPVTSDALYPTNTGSGWSAGSAVITKLSMDGDKLVYSTYYGGSAQEFPSAVRVKRTSCVSNIILGGFTASSNYPVTIGAYRTKPSNSQGYWTGFVSKFRDTLRTEKIDLGPDVLKCDVIGMVLDALNQGSDMKWNTGEKGRFLVPEEPGLYWVEATYGCDTVRDTVQIWLEYSPRVPVLPDDSIFCDQMPLMLLDAKNDTIGASYFWSTGEKTQTIEVSDTGKYVLRISTPNCGDQWDSVRYTMRRSPDLAVLNDSVFCDSVSWLVNVRSVLDSFDYRWSTGDSLTRLQVKDTGWYWVRMSNLCGMDSTAFRVDLLHSPLALLPPDSIFCNLVALNVQSGSDNNEEEYTWFDLQLQQTLLNRSNNLNLTGPGAWSLEISNRCGVSRDTIEARLLVNPEANLGRDSVFCNLVDLTLVPGRTGNEENYLWHDLSADSFFQVTNPGWVKVQISNRCGVSQDSVFYLLRLSPFVDLPDDSVFCNQVAWEFDATSAENTTKYLWNTGDTTPRLSVSGPGVYRVSLSNTCGTITDSVRVSLLSTPQFSFAQNEYVFCDRVVPFQLKTAPDPQNEEQVRWFNGATLSDFNVTDTGVFRAEIWNRCGSTFDSVLVRVSQSPVVNLGPDTILCGNFSLILDAGNPGMTYLWEPGGETTQQITVKQQTTFRVRVSNADGCFAEDDFTVGSNCISKYFIPDAFSPNNDGLNEVFRPQLINFEQFEMHIFNRWGEHLFSTNDPSLGWDGTYKGEILPAGMYLYSMRFITTEDAQFRNFSGILHLMK